MKRSVKTKMNSSRSVRQTQSAVLQPSKARRQPTEGEIRQRAYEIYLKRGENHGQDLEDWLQAEKELTETLNRFSS